jgi:hypothetical protein
MYTAVAGMYGAVAGMYRAVAGMYRAAAGMYRAEDVATRAEVVVTRAEVVVTRAARCRQSSEDFSIKTVEYVKMLSWFFIKAQLIIRPFGGLGDSPGDLRFAP